MKRIRFRAKQQQKQFAKELYKINERITVPEVMLIDDEGQMLGVTKTYKALEMAKEKNLDLVEVSPKAQPPVAKILDYGNFKYHQEKAAKKQKAQQKKTDLKELRLSPRIGQHDLDVRIKQAQKFLANGDKISVDLILKGRERQHPELAKQVMTDFVEKIKANFEIKFEQEIKRQGNKFSFIVAPVKSVEEEKNEEQKPEIKNLGSNEAKNID